MNKAMKEYRSALGQLGYVVFEMYTDYRSFGRRRKLVIRPSEGGLMDRKRYHEDMKQIFGQRVDFDPYGNVLLREHLFSLTKEEVKILCYPGEEIKEEEDKVYERMLSWLDKVKGDQ